MDKIRSKLLLILSALCLILVCSDALAQWPPRLYRTIDGIVFEDYDIGNGETIRIRKIYYSLGGGFSWGCSTTGCNCSDRPSCNSASNGIFLEPGEGCAYGLCDTPPGGSHYYYHCQTNWEGGWSVQHCSVHSRYCIWEQVGDCKHIAKEPDDWVGFPYDPISLTLRPCGNNPDTTEVDSLRYMPMYDSTLCYELRATYPMSVMVTLGSSCYEGIAMNAPVPDDQSEKKADMILEGAALPPLYRYHTASCSLIVTLEADEPYEVYVRLLDYAAEGSISAVQVFDNRVRGVPATVPNGGGTSIKIPQGYQDWKSDADPDSDGLTLWEEYRGFRCLDGSHLRLDLDTIKTRRNILVIDQDSLFHDASIEGFLPRLQEMMKFMKYPGTDSARVEACSLVVTYGDTNEVLTERIRRAAPDPYGNLRYECIDTYQGRWEQPETGPGHWEANSFTIPRPPLAFPSPADSTHVDDQHNGDDWVRSSDQVALRVRNFPIEANYGWNYYGTVNHLRGYGICGNAHVLIDRNRIFNEIAEDWWRHDPDTGVGGWGPDSDYRLLFESVCEIVLRRTLAHEMGHTINAPDHSPQYSGNLYGCVMMNEKLRHYSPCRPECVGYVRHDNCNDGLTCESAWNVWIDVWSDDPNHSDNKWGYINDPTLGVQCADSIRYRQ